MCGIVGLIAGQLDEDRARTVVGKMAARIVHRGPDGGGLAFHPDATLAMTRLAIVDVQHGTQPMSNDDGSVVIVFNGEIYNAPALRAELEAQHVRFRTRSDTEVILRLYERDAARVEEYLAGMWAFAIHDRNRRRVVLSRDRFGIKPMFIADAGRALAFASELGCFDRSLSSFAALFSIDHDAAHAMLSWSFVPDNRTIYQGVRRLEPGTRLEVDVDTGARVSRSYWQLRASRDAERATSLEEAEYEVERLLRTAVKEHLESDVPVATFLSGGIDSSLVTWLAKECSTKRLSAYCIGFREPRFDESPHAAATAKILGVDLHVTRFDEAMAREALPEMLAAYDEPFGDASSLATYMLSRDVAREYKVALGGDGGDEVFAGYKKHQIITLRQPLARTPGLRDTVGRALALVPTRADRTLAWTELLRTVARLSRGLRGSDAEVYASLSQVAPLAQTQALLRRPTNPRHFVDALIARFVAAPGTELEKTLRGDLANTLPNDMLVKVDRASMANHLEVRVPFLDHRVVEYGIGLPARFTLRHGGKRVLRSLHERRFGSSLAHRPKQGFGVPVETWLRGPFDAACTELFSRERLDRFGILSSESLANGRFREWAHRAPVLLWHAFSLAAWCEVHLGDGPASLAKVLRARG